MVSSWLRPPAAVRHGLYPIRVRWMLAAYESWRQPLLGSMAGPHPASASVFRSAVATVLRPEDKNSARIIPIAVRMATMMNSRSTASAKVRSWVCWYRAQTLSQSGIAGEPRCRMGVFAGARRRDQRAVEPAGGSATR